MQNPGQSGSPGPAIALPASAIGSPGSQVSAKAASLLDLQSSAAFASENAVTDSQGSPKKRAEESSPTSLNGSEAHHTLQHAVYLQSCQC